MAEDEIPKLADWLAEYRSRPEPVEIIVASYDLPEPIPDDPVHGMTAGQTGIDIVRYDATGRPGPPDKSHYVMGVDGRGQHTWDDWYETEDDARRDRERPLRGRGRAPPQPRLIARAASHADARRLLSVEQVNAEGVP